MLRIGRDLVLAAHTVLLRENETARLEIPLPLGAAIATDVVKIEITCTQRSQADVDIKWRTENGVVKFDLLGWKSQVGSMLNDAVTFGFQNGRALRLKVAQYAISDQNVVHFMVMQEEPTP